MSLLKIDYKDLEYVKAILNKKGIECEEVHAFEIAMDDEAEFRVQAIEDEYGSIDKKLRDRIVNTISEELQDNDKVMDSELIYDITVDAIKELIPNYFDIK